MRARHPQRGVAWAIPASDFIESARPIQHSRVARKLRGNHVHFSPVAILFFGFAHG
jgi:hypothetical protein